MLLNVWAHCFFLGNYTCSLNSSGTLQAKSTILGNIKTLQISSSDNVDSFSDGDQFNLTCCSPDIGEFNVTWTENGPAGELLTLFSFQWVSKNTAEHQTNIKRPLQALKASCTWSHVAV